MRKAKDFAKIALDKSVKYNRMSMIENKIPIEQVMKTAKSRGQIQIASHKLNPMIALSGALAVGAKIREDIENAQTKVVEPEMIQ